MGVDDFMYVLYRTKTIIEFWLELLITVQF